LQFPTNIDIHFSKVRTAKKKKDKAGRKVGKGGNIGEGLHRTTDLSLKDTSNFVLWEYSVSLLHFLMHLIGNNEKSFRKSIHRLYPTSVWVARW